MQERPDTQAGRLRYSQRVGVLHRLGRGGRAIQRVANFRSGLQRCRQGHGDGLLEEVGTQSGAPRRDAHRVHHPVLAPAAEPGQFLLKVDRRSQVLLEMSHHLLGVEVGCEIAGRIVAGVRIGHVAGQHTLETGRLHRAQAHGLAQQADLGVEPDINEVGQAVLLAQRVHLGLRVRHPVVAAND